MKLERVETRETAINANVVALANMVKDMFADQCPARGKVIVLKDITLTPDADDPADADMIRRITAREQIVEARKSQMEAIPDDASDVDKLDARRVYDSAVKALADLKKECFGYETTSAGNVKLRDGSLLARMAQALVIVNADVQWLNGTTINFVSVDEDKQTINLKRYYAKRGGKRTKLDDLAVLLAKQDADLERELKDAIGTSESVSE